jgi:hypothetical protein
MPRPLVAGHPAKVAASMALEKWEGTRAVALCIAQSSEEPMAKAAHHFASGHPHLFKITAGANESFAHVGSVQLEEKKIPSQASWKPSVIPRSDFINPTDTVIQFRSIPTFVARVELDGTGGDGLLNITFLPDEPVPTVTLTSVYTSQDQVLFADEDSEAGSRVVNINIY